MSAVYSRGRISSCAGPRPMHRRSGREPISRYPCLGVGAPRHRRAPRPARRVLPQACGRLPRGSLGAVARRPPRADLAHGRRAHPVRRHHVLRGGRGEAQGPRRLRVRAGRGGGPRRRGLLLRRRDHRWAVGAPGAGAREPRRAGSRVRFVARHDTGSRVPDRRPARRARALKGTLNIYRAGYQEFTEDEFRLARALRRCGRARDRQRPHPRDARAPGADRPADGPLERPRVPRAAARGSSRVDRSYVGRARDARPRRLQARQRHLQPRDGRPRARRRSRRSPCGRAPTDTVCRVGGEEFAIMVPVERPRDASRLAERLQERITATTARPGRARQRVDRHRLGARPTPRTPASSWRAQRSR